MSTMPMSFIPDPRQDSIHFEGTQAFLHKDTGLTGAADSKTGILSFWVKLDSNISGENILWGNAGYINVNFGGLPGPLDITMSNSAGATILRLLSTTDYSAGSAWKHFLVSWDLTDTAKRHLYVQDVSDLTVITYTNDTIDYTLPLWAIGNSNELIPIDMYVGGLYDFYFAPGQYLDFSILSNRRLFISSTGKPVSLGATGSTPTGVAPLVFLHLDYHTIEETIATNKGTGGNFTIAGSINYASSSPLD